MSQRVLFLFAFLALLALDSCKSQDPTTGTTTVSGQVVVYQTTKGVANAQVQVYHASSSGGYVPVGQPYAADAQGRFTFSFEADYKTGYLVLATAPPGYLTDWALAPALTAGHGNENVLIPTYAPAFVRLQLVDEPPKNRVTITITGYSGSGETLRYPHDTTLVRGILSNFNTGIGWWITDQNTGKEIHSSQFIQPSALDTVTVRIPF